MLRALAVLLLVAGPASATALRPSFDMRGDLAMRVFPSASLPTPVVQMIPRNYTPASDPPTLANTGSAGGTWARTYSYGGGAAGSSAVDSTKLTVDSGAIFNRLYYSGLTTGITAGEPFTVAIRFGVTATGASFVYDVASEVQINDSTGRVEFSSGNPWRLRPMVFGDKATVVLQCDGANMTLNVDGSETTVANSSAISGSMGLTVSNNPTKMLIYRYEVWDSIVPIANIKAVYDAI